jgi:hypothetical protein
MTLSSRDMPSFPNTAKGNVELMAHAHEKLGTSTKSVDAFLLKYGEEFDVNPTPDWVELMTPKMCFMNCFVLVEEQRGGLLSEDIPELYYCEGYVLSSGLPIPIHHAWCVQDDGTLIEPTLPDRTDEEKVTYFGVKIEDFEALDDLLNLTGTYSVLFKRHGHELIERLAEERRG